MFLKQSQFRKIRLSKNKVAIILDRRKPPTEGDTISVTGKDGIVYTATFTKT